MNKFTKNLLYAVGIFAVYILVATFFHMPIFGGWKTFLVVEPCSPQVVRWHIGWIVNGSYEVSQIILTKYVRVLLNPTAVQFFALDANGTQIEIQVKGYGKISKAGVYSKVPLL